MTIKNKMEKQQSWAWEADLASLWWTAGPAALWTISRKVIISGEAGGSGKGSRYCCVRIQDHTLYLGRDFLKRHLEFVASLSFPFPDSCC